VSRETLKSEAKQFVPDLPRTGQRHKVFLIYVVDKDGHRTVQLFVKWNGVTDVERLISLKKNDCSVIIAVKTCNIFIIPSNFPCFIFHTFILDRTGVGFLKLN
jgi:hypothetical protein